MNPPAAHTLRDPIEAFVAGRHHRRAAPPVPLRGLDLSVTIRGGLAVVEATRTYVNDESDPIEALLTLPVPVHAAFFGLSARIGGVLHHGQAQSKVAARARYEEGLHQGRAAVLHEELLRGVHSLSLANLGPGESAEVTMRWAEALRCNGPVGRLRIPMTVGHVYGCSGLEDADELVSGAKALAAGLKVVHDARRVSLEASGGGAAGEQPGLAATVPTDAPVDLRVDGWRQGDVTGRMWNGKRLTLRFEPAGEGDEPLDVAVLLDRSGSMDSRCEGATDRRITKHRAAVEAIADLARRLRPDDRMALWQFDTVCEPVGPEQPGPVADVPAWVRRLGEPRGGTEIGRSIMRCAARAGVRDILLVTDGQSYAMNPHALARKSGRVFVVLVGEDSLEANVGHLAALSGGDVRFSVGSDMGPAIAGILAGLRNSADSSTAGSVRIRATEAGEAAPEGVKVERSVTEAAVGAYAAHLALPGLDEKEAGDLAVREGLVTHLTSLSIVDEERARQEGLPEMRKVELARPRVAAYAADPSFGFREESEHYGIACDAPDFDSLYNAPPSPLARRMYSRLPHCQGIMPESSSASATGPSSDAEIILAELAGELMSQVPRSVLASLAAQIDWRHARALAKADLTGQSSDIARQIVELSGLDTVADFADAIGLAPLAAAIAALALLAQRQRRLARRVFRAIAAAGAPPPRG